MCVLAAFMATTVGFNLRAFDIKEFGHLARMRSYDNPTSVLSRAPPHLSQASECSRIKDEGRPVDLFHERGAERSRWNDQSRRKKSPRVESLL